MKIIAGLVDLRGEPADPNVLQRMADPVRAHTGWEPRLWQWESAACLDATPPGKGAGKELLKPVSLGGYHILVDARVDNRKELAGALGLSRDKEVTDDRLLLEAYLKWGDRCGARILGDFALAIWSEGRGEVFGLRDTAGVRPFFYYSDGKRVYFANHLGAVVAGLESHPGLDPDFVRGFLMFRFDLSLTHTVYNGVWRLPPAHCLSVASTHVSVRQYWSFGQGEQEQERPDTELIEDLRERLRAAVRDRFESDSGVAVSLSGGVDSSAIACLGYELRHGLEASGRAKLLTFTYPDEYPRLQEREYAEAVAQWCSDFNWRCIDGAGNWGLRIDSSARRVLAYEPGVHLAPRAEVLLASVAHEAGCDAILKGTGSDYAFLRGWEARPEMFCGLDWGERLRALPLFVRRGGRRRFPSSLMRYMFEGIVGGAKGGEIRRALRASIAPWLLGQRYRDLVIDGTRARRAALDTRGGARSGAAHALAAAGGGYQVRILEEERAFGLAAGVEYRFPYLDRRVMDLVSRLPNRLFVGDGLNKRILRLAMQGIVPNRVRRRMNFAEGGALIDYGFRVKERSSVDQLLDTMPNTLGSFMDTDAFVTEWRRYQAGSSGADLRQLYAGVLMQDWLINSRGQSTNRYGRHSDV